MSKKLHPTAAPSEAGKDENQSATRQEFLVSVPPPPDPQFAPPVVGFIDQAELLRRLPVSRRTIHNWRLAGKIPSIVIGRRVLFCWESVAQALRRLERGAE